MVVSVSAAAWVFGLEVLLFGMLRKYLLEQSTLMICFVLAGIVFLFAAVNAEEAKAVLINRSLREIKTSSIAAWTCFAALCCAVVFLLTFRSNEVSKVLTQWNKQTNNLLLIVALSAVACLFIYK